MKLQTPASYPSGRIAGGGHHGVTLRPLVRPRGVEANGEEEGAGRLDGGQGQLVLLRAQLLPLTHRHVLHIAPDQLPHEGLERSIGKGTRIAGGGGGAKGEALHVPQQPGGIQGRPKVGPAIEEHEGVPPALLLPVRQNYTPPPRWLTRFQDLAWKP